MKRVVVTGMGIVSSIGNNVEEVTLSLREAKSGITFSEEFAEHGFRCQVWGAPTLDPTGLVDRRAMRFLSKGGAWNHVAMQQAIADSGLEENEVSHERTGIVMGFGRPVHTHDRRGGGHYPGKGQSQAYRALCSSQGHVFHCVGNACHLVQDPRRQLFDFLSLLHICPLHRQCL